MDEAAFAPGEHVYVPWGLDVVDGTVLFSRRVGSALRIVVQVIEPNAEDDTEPLVMVFRPEDLKIAAEEASERQPGSWLSGVHYEEALEDAIRHILNRWPETNHDIERPSFIEKYNLADFTLKAADHLVLIQAKALVAGQVQGKMLDKLWSDALRSRIPFALLVTNTDLSISARRRLEELLRSGANIRVVHWSSPEDNDALSRAIEGLLAGS